MNRKIYSFIAALCWLASACGRVSLPTPTATVTATFTAVPTATSEPTSTLTPMPAPQLIEVEGRKLYIQCMGSGSPVVILESGLGVYSGTWYKVAPEVAKFTRVCVYDRFGLGSSDSGLPPRTSEHMVAELHELLTNAQIPAPYILVGHSFGGLNIRLFASTYPTEVLGLVFVDAVHPDLDKKLEPLLPPALVQERREELALNPEGIKFEDILTSEDQVRAAASIADMPIIVIRHGIPFDGGPDWPTAKVEALWEELQNDLAKLNSQGKVILAENSHHRIQEDRPDVVILAIQDIFNQVHK